MNQKLKRYYLSVEYKDAAHMAEHDDGDYVTYEDYQKLQEQLRKAEAKKHEIIQYCMRYDKFQFMWAAEILSILLECDFRDASDIARQYFKEKESK